MNPQEKLSEIKTRHTELTLSQHISDAHVNWLIARVEQLEKVLRQLDEMAERYQLQCDCGDIAMRAIHTGPKPE